MKRNRHRDFARQVLSRFENAKRKALGERYTLDKAEAFKLNYLADAFKRFEIRHRKR